MDGGASCEGGPRYFRRSQPVLGHNNLRGYGDLQSFCQPRS